MKSKWIYKTDGVDWMELSALYKAAPLGDKSPEALKEVFANSRYVCFVYDETVLAGVGRVLADGADCAYLCDVAVLPSYQGEGLGKAIVKKLVSFSQGHKKIILYANPGKEVFYHALGFRPMLTAMAIFEDQQQAVASGLIDNV